VNRKRLGPARPLSVRTVIQQMASPELIELWKKIDADLRRARGTLPPRKRHNA
jgi:hypothetical protein